MPYPAAGSVHPAMSVSDTTPALMRRIDAVCAISVYRHPDAAGVVTAGGLCHWETTGSHTAARDEHHGKLSDTGNLAAASRPLDVALAGTPAGDCATESGVGVGYHQRLDVTRLRVSLYNFRLGQSPGVCLAAIQHPTTDFCREAVQEMISQHAMP